MQTFWAQGSQLGRCAIESKMVALAFWDGSNHARLAPPRVGDLLALEPSRASNHTPPGVPNPGPRGLGADGWSPHFSTSSYASFITLVSYSSHPTPHPIPSLRRLLVPVLSKSDSSHFSPPNTPAAPVSVSVAPRSQPSQYHPVRCHCTAHALNPSSQPCSATSPSDCRLACVSGRHSISTILSIDRQPYSTQPAQPIQLQACCCIHSSPTHKHLSAGPP